MSKKWKVIAPLALAAAGALAAGIATLLNKPQTEDTPKKAPAAQAGPAKAPRPPQNVMAGAYSFISGFQDAVTEEMTVKYDADKFSYAVVEDEFIASSSDSHVAILWGESFNMQLEYGAYYQGEDFQGLKKHLSERYPELRPAVYGANEGLQFQEGDDLCMVFPVPQDAHSYILVTLVKAKDNDDELAALADYEDVKFMLSSLGFERR